MCRLRSRLFGHLMSQEIGFFDRIRTGELMNRLSEVSPSALNMRWPSSHLPDGNETVGALFVHYC